MPELNPSGAAARLIAARTNQPGNCLIGVGAATLNGHLVIDHAATALDAWRDAANYQQPGAGPKDFPLFFSGGVAGDIAISLGDGINCAATDANRKYGHTGIQTIASRASQVGGHLLGHTTRLLGWDLVTTSTAGDNATPIPDPSTVITSIRKAGPHVKFMFLGNLDTGAIAFLIVGAKGHIFASIDEFENFRTVLNALATPTLNTPAEWLWPPIPEASHQTMLFVNTAQWTTTIQVLCPA